METRFFIVWLLCLFQLGFTDPVVYVANNQGASISIFDTVTNTTTGYVNNNSFDLTHPIDLHFLPDFSKGYVVCDSVNAVYVINPVANIITGPVTTGAHPFNAPAVMALIPSQSKAYVTNEGSNEVSVINTTTDTVTGYVNFATFPFDLPIGVAISPDQTKAYVVSFNGTNHVSIINTATDTVTGYVTTPISFPFFLPTLITFVSNSKAYVSNVGGFVSIIDATTNTVTGYIAHSFMNPENILVSPDGKLVYIADVTANQVIVVDATTDAVVGMLTGAFSFPLGMVFSPDASQLYVGNTAGNDVIIINLSSGMQSGTVNSAPFPFIVPYQLASLYAPVPVGFAPTFISGKHKKNRFAVQYEWYNEIRWMPSLGSNIIHYNIYRNGAFVKSIQYGQELIFQDHDISKNSIYIYAVTAVNVSLAESTPVHITLGK